MPQIQSSYDEVRIPFTNMTFSPDVPSTALGPNEYNQGLNIKSDIRGIRSVAGDQAILSNVPGTPTFITGGFRQEQDTANSFWFIVATDEGYWYASNGVIPWYNITPGGGPIMGYSQSSNIMASWNGTVPFLNDALTAPMFLPDTPGAVLTQYSNLIQPSGITDITLQIGTTNVYEITFSNEYITPPYIAGQQVTLTGIDNYWNGNYVVVSSTIAYVRIIIVPGAAYPGGEVGTVSPAYTWNYNPNWSSYYANFLRLYSTPNVGSILVAGNLSATNVNDSSTSNYPVTIQWSQAFGLNQAPSTWTPTITNVANQLEVPLRGPALDAFPSNGQFFLCSYWDTVVLSPINYSTTSAPILGVRIYNQGRGLLSSNCWANTDTSVYGIDARDVWVFDGNNFTGIGNQRVKNWLFDQLDPQYYNRVFMQCNTQKNQVEIFYPDMDAINGVPNKMLSYRYDIDVWNAPKEVDSATMSCESPIYVGTQAQLGSRTVVYARGLTNEMIAQEDVGYTHPNGSAIYSYFRRDNIKMIKDYSGKLMVNRILPEAVNLGAVPFSGTYNIPITPSTGAISVKIEGAESVGSLPIETTSVQMNLDTSDPWCQIDQNSHRVNSIVIENTSNVNVWLCSATTWQYTQTEDDR